MQQINITIIDGDPSEQQHNRHDYIDSLIKHLTLEGHHVTHFKLRAMKLNYCVGCWDCWVKTPGQCSHPDDTHFIRRAVVNSDYVLWASPLIMGFTSALLKMSQDKLIPILSPYFRHIKNEIHHMQRYSSYPSFGLLLKKESDTTMEDLAIVEGIFQRFALNFSTTLKGMATTDKPLREIINELAFF